MKRTIAALVLALLLLAACSSEKSTSTTSANQQPGSTPPTAAQARAIIEKSGEFSQYEFTNAAVSLPVSGANTSEVAKQLAAAGWLFMDGSGEIMLSDKSRTDKRFILRENGLLDIVPMARKELGDVTAVRTNADGTVNADFHWTWIPNEIGATFTAGPIHDRFAGTQNATANLMWNGTEWVMISVEKK